MALDDLVKGMILRGRIKATRPASNGLVQVDVEVLPGDIPTVEVLANYGFASAPPVESEAIVVAVQGKSEDLVVVAVDNRRFRFALVEGEVVIFDDLGQAVHLSRTGIVVKAPSIKLGEGATAGVARDGDAITLDAALLDWLDRVAAAAASPTPSSPGPRPSGGGTITSASSVVKAVG